MFVETFAFFFLRLYKNALSEIKYYHNQMTKLATLRIALEAAIAADNAECVASIVKEVCTSWNQVALPTTDDKLTLGSEQLVDIGQKIALGVTQVLEKVKTKLLAAVPVLPLPAFALNRFAFSTL